VFVGAVSEGQWVTLCRYLGLDGLLADPGLQKRMDQIEARARTIPVFAAAIRLRERATLVVDLERLGLPFSPINKPSDMFTDPHVMRPGGLARSTLASGESFRAPALPFEVDGVMLTGGGDVDAVGAHTAAVLAGLGLGPAEIAAATGEAA
jgi:crotonobetainyl-CoA:carnitine CoA-transferase CaiB-like acyl-CoA transferase